MTNAERLHTELAARIAHHEAVGDIAGRRATIPFKFLFSTEPAETVQIEIDFVPESLAAP